VAERHEVEVSLDSQVILRLEISDSDVAVTVAPWLTLPDRRASGPVTRQNTGDSPKHAAPKDKR